MEWSNATEFKDVTFKTQDSEALSKPSKFLQIFTVSASDEQFG